MNYAEMSDAEIAEAVIKTITLDDCEYWRPSATGRGVVIVNDDNETMRTFDPCNNPADAWPLIVDNEISILVGKERSSLAFHGVKKDAYHKPCWYEFSFSCRRNPLRAAAIVYLMMKEAGK